MMTTAIGAARAELVELARFLRAPRRLHPQRGSRRWMPRALFFAALLVLADLIASALVLAPLAAWAHLGEPYGDAPTIRFAFLAIGAAPLLEELVFRAGLRSARYTLFVGPVLIAAAAIPWDRRGLTAIAGVAMAALLADVVVRRCLRRRAGARVAAARRFLHNYGWIYWGYALAFAAMHIGNYAAHGPRSMAVGAMVLPQLAVGCVAGYLRLRDGLRASVLLHVAVNAVGVGLLAAGI